VVTNWSQKGEMGEGAKRVGGETLYHKEILVHLAGHCQNFLPRKYRDSNVQYAAKTNGYSTLSQTSVLVNLGFGRDGVVRA